MAVRRRKTRKSPARKSHKRKTSHRKTHKRTGGSVRVKGYTRRKPRRR